mmetsp:Transcript_31731/g.76813  ORF Transcript_31731/g.76813 Transcript_31731/m.76813 type:complete len:91 (+) Transcript_31731:783-1055(+)
MASYLTARSKNQNNWNRSKFDKSEWPLSRKNLVPFANFTTRTIRAVWYLHETVENSARLQVSWILETCCLQKEFMTPPEPSTPVRASRSS